MRDRLKVYIPEGSTTRGDAFRYFQLPRPASGQTEEPEGGMTYVDGDSMTYIDGTPMTFIE